MENLAPGWHCNEEKQLVFGEFHFTVTLLMVVLEAREMEEAFCPNNRRERKPHMRACAISVPNGGLEVFAPAPRQSLLASGTVIVGSLFCVTAKHSIKSRNNRLDRVHD